MGAQQPAAGAEPKAGEGTAGVAVKHRPRPASTSSSPAKTVGQLVATLLGPELTRLETSALMEAQAEEVTAAARGKGDKGSGEGAEESAQCQGVGRMRR